MIMAISDNSDNFWKLWKLTSLKKPHLLGVQEIMMVLNLWETLLWLKRCWWCSVGTGLRCEGFVAAQPYRGSLSQGTPRLIGRLPVLSQLFDGKKNLISTGSVWPLPPMPYPLDQRILTQANNSREALNICLKAKEPKCWLVWINHGQWCDWQDLSQICGWAVALHAGHQSSVFSPGRISITVCILWQTSRRGTVLGRPPSPLGVGAQSSRGRVPLLIRRISTITQAHFPRLLLLLCLPSDSPHMNPLSNHQP